MNEQERRKQRVYDHLGTALECIGSVLGGPYGLDLDNAVTRRICRIKLVDACAALATAIGGVDGYENVAIVEDILTGLEFGPGA